MAAASWGVNSGATASRQKRRLQRVHTLLCLVEKMTLGELKALLEDALPVLFFSRTIGAFTSMLIVTIEGAADLLAMGGGKRPQTAGHGASRHSH